MSAGVELPENLRIGKYRVIEGPDAASEYACEAYVLDGGPDFGGISGPGVFDMQILSRYPLPDEADSSTFLDWIYKDIYVLPVEGEE